MSDESKWLKIPDFLRNQMELNNELRKENAELRRQLSETAALAYLRLQTIKKLKAENFKLSNKLSVATDADGNARPYGE